MASTCTCILVKKLEDDLIIQHGFHQTPVLQEIEIGGRHDNKLSFEVFVSETKWLTLLVGGTSNVNYG